MKQRLVKVICWRFLSVFITMIVMWFATGNIREATGVTLALHALLTAANYGFEVVWDKVNEEG
jgi:uncharacterized membrane protein